MGIAMADLWDAKRFARWRYDVREPTKAQLNVVLRMCAEGKLPARKIGRKWYIDTREILRGFEGGAKV